jgi:TRAP-type C4-dicarboxylate transport system permease small subunit
MIERFSRAFARAEDALLATLVGALILLAGTQILLRMFFQWGLPWAEPLLRALVLWTALLGAMAAARENKHLALDAAAHWLKGGWLRIARFLTQAFAAVVAGVMGWYGYALIVLEREGGAEAFLGVPVWAVQLILPLAFGTMALRFAARALRAAFDRLQPGDTSPSAEAIALDAGPGPADDGERRA